MSLQNAALTNVELFMEEYEFWKKDPCCQTLFQSIDQLYTQPLILNSDSFTSPSRTPWGGREILEMIKCDLGLDHQEAIGESWELSDDVQMAKSCLFKFNGEDYSLPLPLLKKHNAQALLGKYAQLPFLVKIINTGSWRKLKEEISLDVHYHQALQALKKAANKEVYKKVVRNNVSIQVHPKGKKEECWYILSAEVGSGIYLGLKQGVSRSKWKEALENGDDPSELMNFIPVKAGDVYFVPSGVFHSIGAGVLLMEAQTPVDITYRAFDWGRSRKLHSQECIDGADWTAPKGSDCVSALNQPLKLQKAESVCYDRIADFKTFSFSRLQFYHKEAEFRVKKGVQGFIVTQGSMIISLKGNDYHIKQGQSVLVPAQMKDFILRSDSNFLEVFWSNTIH